MNMFQNCENMADSEYILNERINMSSSPKVLQFLRNKLTAIKLHNYKTNNFKEIIRFFRLKIGLNKSAKRKGYGQFFAEEERRYSPSFFFCA